MTNAENTFDRIWTLLVEEADAIEDDRQSFVRAYTRDKHTTEWRFGGMLGFGGKFWRNNNRYYVSCYPEDRTKRREAVIAHINEKLEKFPYFPAPT